MRLGGEPSHSESVAACTASRETFASSAFLPFHTGFETGGGACDELSRLGRMVRSLCRPPLDTYIFAETATPMVTIARMSPAIAPKEIPYEVVISSSSKLISGADGAADGMGVTGAHKAWPARHPVTGNNTLLDMIATIGAAHTACAVSMLTPDTRRKHTVAVIPMVPGVSLTATLSGGKKVPVVV